MKKKRKKKIWKKNKTKSIGWGNKSDSRFAIFVSFCFILFYFSLIFRLNGIADKRDTLLLFLMLNNWLLHSVDRISACIFFFCSIFRNLILRKQKTLHRIMPKSKQTIFDGAFFFLFHFILFIVNIYCHLFVFSQVNISYFVRNQTLRAAFIWLILLLGNQIVQQEKFCLFLRWISFSISNRTTNDLQNK